MDPGAMNESFRYPESYEETVELDGDLKALVRRILPSDKSLLQAGFQRMSERSRYQRCMAEKLKLTDQELRYFTEVDGQDHFALGALRSPLGSPAIGMGTGRFVRLHEPDVAEPAITIVDEYQQKGLGRVLLERLVGAAWERDIRWLHFELLASNLGMKRLLDVVSHHEVKFTNEGAGCLTARFPCPHPEHVETEPELFRESPLFRLFVHVAAPDIEITIRHRATLGDTQPP